MSGVKTNAMRILDKHKIAYKTYCYAGSGAVAGVEVAAALGQNPAQVFKTLVTAGKSGAHYVFMLPVAEELDLKKAARAVNEKAVEMIKQKELLPLTGYVHGGCSPIGMKKLFQTVIHHTAGDFPTIIFSAGMVGYQVEMPLAALQSLIPVTAADIVAG